MPIKLRNLSALFKRKWYDLNAAQRIFIVGALCLFACAIFRLFYDRGGRNFFALFHPVPNDTFMDFFNSIYDASVENPYTERGVIYPPLVYCFYRLMHRVLLFTQGGSFDWRNSQKGILLAVFITGVIIAALWVVMRKICADNLKNIFPFVILFATEPFLFAYERGNSILAALFFLLLFVIWHDSENAVSREIALLSLAVAASIKIYPAIWGLLLLREKRYKEASRCILYGVTIFAVPFVFFGGFKNIITLVGNIVSTSDKMDSKGYGIRVDIRNIAGLIGNAAHVSTSVITAVFQIAVILVCLVITFKAQEKWKVFLALSEMMILVPNFSYTYSLVYLTIPALYFFGENDRYTFFDGVYSVLFLCCFGVFPFGGYKFFPFEKTVTYNMTLYCIIEVVALWMLLVMPFIERAVPEGIKQRTIIIGGGGVLPAR